MIIGQLDRILFLAHPEYHKKNIEFMISVLLSNVYPLDIIFSTINKRIKTLSRKKDLYTITTKNINDSNNNNPKLFHDIIHARNFGKI